MNTNKNYFISHDLNISAVLIAVGHRLDHIERAPSGRAAFLFEETSSLRESLQKYWSLELKLNPQKIFDSLKFLKTRLYNEGSYIEPRSR